MVAGTAIGAMVKQGELCETKKIKQAAGWTRINGMVKKKKRVKEKNTTKHKTTTG